MPNPENLIGKGFDKHPENINKKGRPKFPDISEALAKILEGDEDGMTALEEILRALVKKAKKGDVKCAQELFDRAYGKPKLSMDLGINKLQGKFIEPPNKET
jgi:hypothetical protein